ncbi:hypothetical protein FQN54_000723 [Arachnomyces sp. PD_36]|nr:hypothetical protein FQN54_000723 [Arachnomyces sp. PD_36]
MPLGILESRKGDHVPGTAYVLDEVHSSTESIQTDSHLKYDRSGPVPIILVPQPSDDPNDPLNWPLWRRDLILAILSIVSVLCATASPILAAGTLVLSFNFHTSFTGIALLTGYHLCAVGVAGLLFVPSARVWGKRHLYLFGTLLTIISSAWGGASGSNYNSMLAARIFQGIALAPFESLVNASVGDLYFVHERGKRMAVSNVALFGGSFLTPVIAGKMTADIGWEWTFYFIAIFAAAVFPLVFFFVPETAFRRPDYLNTDFEGDADRPHVPRELRIPPTDSSETPPGASIEEAKENGEATSAANGAANHSDTPEVNATTQPQKVTFAQSLRPFNGRKTDESFFKLFLRPFPLFLHPGILWACLIQGVMIGWTVFFGVVLAAVFMSPPLWFEETETGYLYTGAFVGSILGLGISGLAADWINKIMIKLNKGKYEPEYRIILVVLQLIFGGIGLYGFGYATEDIGRYGWLLPDVFFMFLIIGMVMGAVSSALYIVDAHREIAIEAFTCLLFFKNVFSFVLTFYAYDWVVKGDRPIFTILGSIQVGICFLSVPMYIFGKRNRAFFHRHDILSMCKLR